MKKLLIMKFFMMKLKLLKIFIYSSTDAGRENLHTFGNDYVKGIMHYIF